MIVFNEKSCTWTDIRTVNKSFNKFTYNRIVGNDTSDSNNSFVDESNENGNIKIMNTRITIMTVTTQLYDVHLLKMYMVPQLSISYS